jgi:hypothetical protein
MQTYGDADQAGLNFYVQPTASGSAATLTEAMRITSGGNVLIGTTTDGGAKLRVNGDILIPADGRLYGNSATVTGSRSFIELYNSSTGNINLVTGFATASIVFGTQGGTERMRITSAGKVGIGTATPSNQLEVGGEGIIRIRPKTDNTQSALFFNDTTTAGNSYRSDIGIINDGGLYFSTTNTINTAPTERMRITSGGNVLIGTTTDAGNGVLQVNKSTSNAVARFTNARNTSGDFGLVTGLGSNCNNTSSYHYIAATGGADKFYLYGNGTYATVSDRRLKKNIELVTEQFLQKVLALDIVTYNWNDQKDGSDLELGMIAQQVETNFSSIVKTNRPDLNGQTYKSIQVSALPYILIKAIQELKQEIDTLKN